MTKTRKQLVIKDSGNKWAKRQASKAVRRSKNLQNGGNYKRCYPSYNISDYRSDDRFEENPRFVKHFLKGSPSRDRYVHRAAYLRMHLKNGRWYYYT